MPEPTSNQRSAQRKAMDEQIAAEPFLPHPKMASDAKPVPVENHLCMLHHKGSAPESNARDRAPNQCLLVFIVYA